MEHPRPARHSALFLDEPPRGGIGARYSALCLGEWAAERGGAANSEIGRIWDRMIHPSDPVGGEGKVGRGRKKVGSPERESR